MHREGEKIVPMRSPTSRPLSPAPRCFPKRFGNFRHFGSVDVELAWAVGIDIIKQRMYRETLCTARPSCHHLAQPTRIFQMSKALVSCSDLVRMIVRYLRPVYPSVDELRPGLLWYHHDSEVPNAESSIKARQDLISTARTCRRFSGHALDALWEVLDDIEPLLKILQVQSYNPGQAPLVCDSGWFDIS